VTRIKIVRVILPAVFMLVVFVVAPSIRDPFRAGELAVIVLELR
jgi:hypothetical protein